MSTSSPKIVGSTGSPKINAHSVPKAHHTHKDHHQEPGDRAKTSMVDNRPKKQGGGGKHTWGKLDGHNYDEDGEQLDPNDPMADGKVRAHVSYACWSLLSCEIY
jgi:hypothetical protein